LGGNFVIPHWFWEFAGVLILVISVFLVLSQLRLQRYAHVVSATEILVSKFESERMLKLRLSTCLGLIENRDYYGSDLETLLEFFDRVAAYEAQGALPIPVIWETFSWHFEFYYFLSTSKVAAVRIEYNDPSYLSGIEGLMLRFRQHERSSRVTATIVSDDKLVVKFLQDEIDVARMLLGVEASSATL